MTRHSLSNNFLRLSDLLQSELAKLHPKNAHIPDKIRQQLQVLRDLRLLEFLGGGFYRHS